MTSLGDIADAPMIVAVIAALLGVGRHCVRAVTHRASQQDDLAILRALGLRSSQTGWVITWQATILALISIVLGIPIGIVVGRAGAMWPSSLGP